MIFTDWSQAKAKEDPKYPQSRIMVKEIDLWGDEETLKYISERMALLEKTAAMEQNEMPKCDKNELWTSGESWAIMKNGGKRAMKVHKTEAAAIEHKDTLNSTYHIEHRPGKVARCRYCQARKFCNQHTELVDAGRIEDHDN